MTVNYEDIIEKHMGLIHSIAAKFKSYALSNGVDYDDLIQWSLIELITSHRTYKKGRDMAFSTYAYRNIRRTLINKLKTTRHKGLNHVPIDELLKNNQDQAFAYSPDFDQRIEITNKLSDVLPILFDCIETDTQWAAIIGHLEGEKLSSVAREMGCSHQNVSAAYYRVINKVKKELNV